MKEERFIDIFLKKYFHCIGKSFIVKHGIKRRNRFPVNFHFFFHQLQSLQRICFRQLKSIFQIPGKCRHFRFCLFLIQRKKTGQCHTAGHIRFTESSQKSAKPFRIQPSGSHPHFPQKFFFPNVQRKQLFNRRKPAYLPICLYAHQDFVRITGRIQPDNRFHDRKSVFPAIIQVMNRKQQSQ